MSCEIHGVIFPEWKNHKTGGIWKKYIYYLERVKSNLCVDDILSDLLLCDGDVLQYHLQPHGHHTG